MSPMMSVGLRYSWCEFCN